MGCLFAMFAGIFPRFALFVLWVARPARIDAAFDTFLLPLLGIIFLPFATLMYVLLYTPGRGLTGWDWPRSCRCLRPQGRQPPRHPRDPPGWRPPARTRRAPR